MKSKWTKIEQEAFKEIKRIAVHNILLSYPGFNKEFKIRTNASDFQLGAVIIQDGRPISFYSIKIIGAQLRYIVTEKELLSIVETLKNRTILLGKLLNIYTRHNILTCKTFNTDRLLRWRLVLEDYGPCIQYIQGNKNIVSYSLSRLPIHGDQDTKQKSTYKIKLCQKLITSKNFLKLFFL